SLLGVSSAIQLVRFRAREDPVMEKNIGRIMREVERLNRMSTSLQELGGREAVQLAPGDPDAAWETVLEEHQGRLEARSLALRRSRAATSARCAVNEERLARAFSQVLLNAIENAPEASDLTLESETLPDGGWQCRLVNGGPVVPADTLSRAFEIFFSTRSDGSGIGLALCRRIMDEHHGTIDLTSSEPAGTTATFWLPAAE